MRITNYIIIFILILMCVLIPGELYQDYTTCFSDFYETTFYIQPSISKEKMLLDLKEAAQRNNVEIFMVDTQINNNFSASITVYGDDKVFRYLETGYSIAPGSYESILSGSCMIEFRNFFDMPDSAANCENSSYCLLGPKDDMIRFKQQTVDTYGGKYPKPDGSSQRNSVRSGIIVIWIIAGLFIVYLTFYKLSMNQKEIMVRVSMGTRRLKIFAINSMSDIICILGSYYISVNIFASGTNTRVFEPLVAMLIVIICVLNTLVYLRIFGFSVKSAFSGVEGKKQLLLSCYIIKVVSCLSLVFLISLASDIICEYSDYYRQKDFFDRHCAYNYVSIRSADNSDVYSDKLYRTFHDKTEIYDPCYSLGSGRKSAMLINRCGLKYLTLQIPDLNQYSFDRQAYIIVPQYYRISEENYEFLNSSANSILSEQENFTGEEFSAQVITYKTSSKVIAVENNFIMKSAFVSDPVILYVNDCEYKPLKADDEGRGSGLSDLRTYNYLFDVNSKTLESFAQKNGFDIVITNVGDFYDHNLMVLRRSLFINILFVALVFSLEIMLNILIIRTEYRVHAVELALKKTLGYTAAQRCRVLLSATVLCIILSIAVCSAIKIFAGFGSIAAIFTGNGVVAVTELSLIAAYSIRYEKENVTKILKGG